MSGSQKYTPVNTDEEAALHEVEMDDVLKNDGNHDDITKSSIKEEELIDEHAPLYDKIIFLLCRALPISFGFFLNLGSSFINLIFAGK